MTLGRVNASRNRESYLLPLLVLIFLLGAALRLPHLGQTELSVEEIEMVRSVTSLNPDDRVTLDSGVSSEDEKSSLSSTWHFPLPRFALKAAITLWGQSPTGEKLRIPFAVAGLATILAMAWLGQALGGAPLAVWLALLTAINPFAIYSSRTAHASGLTLLFLSIFGGAIARLFLYFREGPRAEPGELSRKQTSPRRLLVVAAASSAAAAYCSAGTWPVLALAWGPLLWFAHRWAKPQQQNQLRALDMAALGTAILIAPLLLAGPVVWEAGMTRLWHKNLWEPTSPFAALANAPFAFTFGAGWRIVLSLGLPLLALSRASHTKFRYGAQWLAGLGIATSCLLILLPKYFLSTHHDLALRHFAALWPILLGLCGMGAVASTEGWLRWLQTASPKRPIAAIAAVLPLCILALALATPLRALLELEGNPVPYRQLANRLDELTPTGKPVLVNNKLAVTLEMAAHRSSKQIPTYTVPDSPFADWQQNQWRQTAEDFLARFTDAPLLQVGERFFDAPEHGPWAFPASTFAHHEVIRNEPALLLTKMRLAPTQEFYANRSVAQLAYNLEDDLLARSRRQGDEILLAWGEGWGYLKTADLRDWRVLEQEADFVVHNLSTQPTSAILLLEVVASGGRKRLLVGKGEVLVPTTSDIQLLRLHLDLPPGRSVVSLEDDLWPWSRIPLLVYSAKLEKQE